MKEPLTATRGVDITDADVGKLKAGFKARCNMDQKWDMLVEDPDSRGNGGWSLHIIRTWSYNKCPLRTPHRPQQHVDGR